VAELFLDRGVDRMEGSASVAAVGRDDHADIDEVGGVDLRGAGVR
jgi:hypothetical protein